MTRRSKPSRLVFAVTIAISTFSAIAQDVGPKEGVDYQIVKPAQAHTAKAGRTEAIEFFGYWCPHCFVFEPAMAQWAQRSKSRVDVSYVPVAFQAGQVQLQKLYYALDSLGEEQRLRPLIFRAIHEEKALSGSPDNEAMATWVAKHGVDKAKFLEALNAFSMPNKLAHANALAKDYGIPGVPALAIGGQYVLNIQARSIGNADIFVDKVLAQK